MFCREPQDLGLMVSRQKNFKLFFKKVWFEGLPNGRYINSEEFSNANNSDSLTPLLRTSRIKMYGNIAQRCLVRTIF